MSTEPFVPDENDIIMGKIHLGDNFWRELTEEDMARGIAKIKADALRDATAWFQSSPHISYRGTQVIAKLKDIAARIEETND